MSSAGEHIPVHVKEIAEYARKLGAEVSVERVEHGESTGYLLRLDGELTKSRGCLLEIHVDGTVSRSGKSTIVLKLSNLGVAEETVPMELCFSDGAFSEKCYAEQVCLELLMVATTPELLDKTIQYLTSHGFHVSSVELRSPRVVEMEACSSELGVAVYVTVTSNPPPLSTSKIDAVIAVPSTIAGLTDHYGWYYLVEDRLARADSTLLGYYRGVAVTNDKVLVRFEGLPKHTLVPVAKLVVNTVREVERNINALLENTSRPDILAVYLLAASNPLINNVRHLIPLKRSILRDLAAKYLETALGVTLPDDVHRLLELLYEKGVLRVDSELRLVLHGARVIDTAKKYTGGRTRLERSEVNIEVEEGWLVTYLIKRYDIKVVELLGNAPGIDARMVHIVLDTVNDLTSSDRGLFNYLMGNRNLWSRMTREAKKVLLRSIAIRGSLDVVRLARENGWTWVFEDPLVVADAVTIAVRGSMYASPKEVTKALLEYVPELFGDRFEVVYVGGEPFVKIGRVILQVRAVENDVIEAHGTIGTSRVGIVVHGRSIHEVVKAISENLADAVLTFKEIANAVRSNKLRNVEIGAESTPLFTIPTLTIKNGKNSITIPLSSEVNNALRIPVDISDNTNTAIA